MLDRPNWELGKSDINILLLSATGRSISPPRLWTLLPHGGSRAQTDRVALLERSLSVRGATGGGLLADRELVGKPDSSS